MGIAIVGAGEAGRRLAAAANWVVRDFRECSAGPRLMAIVDRDGPSAADLTRRFEFARWRTNWQPMLEDPEIDIVGLTEPKDEQIARCAAKAGKHILFEYHPLSSKSGTEIVAAVKSAGVLTNVSYLHLNNPSILLLRDLLTAGNLGSLTHVRARLTARDATSWAAEGLAESLGDRPECKAVFLAILAILRKAVGEIGSIAVRGFGAQHNSRITIRFLRGPDGIIEICDGFTGIAPSFQIEVSGALGTVAFDSHEPGALKYHKKDADRLAGSTEIYPNASHLPSNVHWMFRSPHFDPVALKAIELASFLFSDHTGDRLAADLYDAQQLQHLLDASSTASTPHPFGV